MNIDECFSAGVEDDNNREQPDRSFKQWWSNLVKGVSYPIGTLCAAVRNWINDALRDDVL